MATAGKKEAAAEATPANPKVKWNVDNLKSSYVNFANANSTKEEVVLNFGMNTSWDRASTQMEIELAHRIVMSPYAAQRLADLLTKLMGEYKTRYGELK
jgi:hypothetical protein